MVDTFSDEAQNSKSQYDNAIEICAHLKKVLMGYRTYAEGHQMLADFRRALFESLTRYLETNEALPLEVSPFALSFGGKPALQANSREESISHQLFLDGVQKITFLQNIGHQELDNFMGLWHATFDNQLDSEHTFATEFWERDYEHLRLVSVETFSETSGDEDEDELARDANRQKNMLEAVISQLSSERLAGGSSGDAGQVRQMRVTADDLLVLKMDAVADITAEDLERQDVAKRPPVSGLSEAEASGIVDEFSSDSQRVVERVVQALLHVSLLAREEELERVDRVMVSIFNAFVRGLQFADLARAMGDAVRTFLQAPPTEVPTRVRSLQRMSQALEDPEVLDPTLSSLDNPDLAPAAAPVLRFLRAEALPLLLARLANIKTAEGRKCLADVIREKKPSAEMIAQSLKDHGAALVREILYINAGIAPEEAAKLLQAALLHPDPLIRQAVLKALPRELIRAFRPRLHPMLEDSSPKVRKAVLDLLVGVRDPILPTKLAPILSKDTLPDEERRSMISALGVLGGKDASAVLRKEFERQSDPEFQVTCAFALGQVADEQARVLLEERAGKRFGNKKVKEACQIALKRLDAQKQQQPGTKGAPS